MRFYRLIKPNWGKPTLANGKPNKDFVKEIQGDNTIEGCDFTLDFLRQKNHEGYNVYFFPNHPSKDIYAEGARYLSGKKVDTFSFVFVDMDLKDGIYASKEEFLEKLLSFKLKPTMVVDSGNGVHAYWRVSDLTRESFVLTQMALLTHFRTDPSVFTVLQLMRAPQFYNTKDMNNFKLAEIRVDSSSNQTYSISEFPKEIYNLSEDKIVKVKNHINRLDGKLEIQLEHEANADELPDEFFTMMRDNDVICGLFNRPKSYKGDRSAADLSLANSLRNRKMRKVDALRVIANTQKALDKGHYRYEYAQLTVDKAYEPTKEFQFKTASEMLEGEGSVPYPKVNGPRYIDGDVLGEPWRKTELLGLIAGSGVGKTAVALDIIKKTIENNPHSNELFVFISLEMPAKMILKRWVKRVGKDSPLTERLIIIDNSDEDGMPRNIGLQQVYEYCNEIIEATGRSLGAVVIDHLHLLSTQISLKKNESGFKVEPDQIVGKSDTQNISINKIASLLKPLMKSLKTFGIILTQTTKEKGIGDTPIGKDGAYGISQYEWIMDRIITVWQPLMRIQHKIPNRYLAYQYVKIREKHEDDTIFENQARLLSYNMDTGSLKLTTPEDYKIFKHNLPEAVEARRKVKEKETDQYSIQIPNELVQKALESVRGPNAPQT